MSMNESEGLAYEWLLKQGYKKNNIIFNCSKSPDFICDDGKRFEVKKIYGNSIIIYRAQAASLKDTDNILVYDLKTKMLIRKFLWKNRDKQNINVKIIKADKELHIIKIWDATKSKLDSLKIIPTESYDSTINRFVTSGSILPSIIPFVGGTIVNKI